MAERPEDLNLPNAVISRIIKEALPEGVNVSKEARSAIARSASVFVLYATSCAKSFAVQAKRKTLAAGDVLAALEEMEFEQFVQSLRDSLEVYKKEIKGKKEASEQRKRNRVEVTVEQQADGQSVDAETGVMVDEGEEAEYGGGVVMEMEN
uniref:DNA polymerase epsilon subunit 3 n=1 Tax=Eptatretus burgeri TaxID=7764 RepID=A0A8C4NB24_EPTBU